MIAESDFIDEWTAVDNAFHLHAELADSHDNVAVVPYPVSHRTCARKSLLSVHFDQVVQLYLGLEDELHFHHIALYIRY